MPAVETLHLFLIGLFESFHLFTFFFIYLNDSFSYPKCPIGYLQTSLLIFLFSDVRVVNLAQDFNLNNVLSLFFKGGGVLLGFFGVCVCGEGEGEGEVARKIERKRGTVEKGKGTNL